MAEALALGARGGGIALAGQAGKLTIHLAAVIVLSRLLSPADFGLIAMVTAFVAFGELLRDFGTSVVGLQRRQLSQQQSSNLFWLSVALGAGAALTLMLGTPLVARLYEEPRVTVVMPALAATVLVNAAAAQFQVRLARALRIGRLVSADLSAHLLGLGVAIVGALAGWDYWALVAQVVTVAVLGFAFRWIFSSWVPSRPRRAHGNRQLIRDSSSFGGAQLLTYISANVDTVIVGARWDAASLGVYSRAFQLLTMPLNSIMGPLTQVVIPTVNRAREEGRSADSVLLRLQFVLGLPIAWVYAMTAAVAAWLVPLLLGSAWEDTVPYFQILAVGGVVWTFSRISYWAFIAANLGTQLLRYNAVTKTLASLLIFGASFISIEAVAWAVSLGLLMSWPINLVWLARTAGQDSRRFFLSGGLLALAAALAWSVATATQAAATSATPDAMAAAVAIAAGTVVYLAVIAAVPSGRRDLVGLGRMVRGVVARRAWRS